LSVFKKLESKITIPRLLEVNLNTTFMNAASLVYNEQVFTRVKADFLRLRSMVK
jgi:hypothetical protein